MVRDLRERGEWQIPKKGNIVHVHGHPERSEDLQLSHTKDSRSCVRWL